MIHHPLIFSSQRRGRIDWWKLSSSPFTMLLAFEEISFEYWSRSVFVHWLDSEFVT